MAYDAATQSVVLFGGLALAGCVAAVVNLRMFGFRKPSGAGAFDRIIRLSNEATARWVSVSELESLSAG